MNEALVHRALELLERAAALCPISDCSDLDRNEIVSVSDRDVAEAVRCQAKLAGPDDGFVVGPFTTYREIGRRAFPRYARGSSPLQAVSSVMKDARESEDWVGTFLLDATQPVRVQTATEAASWLTSCAQLLGLDEAWRWQPGAKYEWAYPGYGLMLKGKVDFFGVFGGVRRAVWVTSSYSDAERARVSYLAALSMLRPGRVIDEVTVLSMSSGEFLSVAASELVDAGMLAARRAADAVVRRRTSPESLDRSASYFTCRSCWWREECTVRTAAEAGPAIRGGVRLAAGAVARP